MSDGNGFRFLKISDHKCFGVLRAGVTMTQCGKRDYARLDITIGTPEQGNLQNKTVSEYHEIISSAFQYLGNEYGIFVDTDGLKFSEMEINCTFVLEEEFYKYRRPLQLMMFLLPKSFRKITQVSNVNNEQSRFETETFYRGNSSMEVKIYDKKKHLEETISYRANDNLMRIELILKTPQKIKEVFETNLVWKLTDDKVNNFYWREFLRLFEKPYRKWQVSNRRQLCNMIAVHKARNIKFWKYNLLAECSNQEQLSQLPVLLDIDDLLEQVRVIEHGKHYTRVAKGILEQCASHDVYLRKDSLKMEEIFSKIHTVYDNYNKFKKVKIKPVCGKVA